MTESRSYMRSRLIGCGLLLLTAASVTSAASVQNPQPAALQAVSARLQQLAAQTTHFATRDIVANGESERRWPANLITEQRHLVDELRATVNERESLTTLLSHADPKMRTLALGALFMREDPRDLPAIARLTTDSEPTFPLLRESMNSAPGPLPLAQFESAQSVGNVAQAMMMFYLNAAFQETAFEQYWAERGARQQTAGWFLARMQRATRQTTPLQPQYQADIRRVLAEIDALSPSERAWTLLYVSMGVAHDRESTLVPDAFLVAALKAIEPDSLLKFLRREPPTDDPDLRSDGRSRRREHSFEMCEFILAHAPNLFRASDADTILAAANGYRERDDATIWFAAAARVRGLDNVESAAATIKTEIQRISLRETLGARNQGVLAFALWQMRGAAERAFLTDWIYTTMPSAGSPNAIEYFFRDVEHEARPDTNALLAAIVGDVRFEQADWTVLSRILVMVNATLPSPLVETGVIYDNRPGSGRSSSSQALANWRTLLRRHFEGTR